ncbi:MAG: hypothetical protein WBQ74_02030 [Candidatus Sulfotelmatobacter sp.]|jgi:hypothetical protein
MPKLATWNAEIFPVFMLLAAVPEFTIPLLSRDDYNTTARGVYRSPVSGTKIVKGKKLTEA